MSSQLLQKGQYSNADFFISRYGIKSIVKSRQFAEEHPTVDVVDQTGTIYDNFILFYIGSRV